MDKLSNLPHVPLMDAPSLSFPNASSDRFVSYCVFGFTGDTDFPRIFTGLDQILEKLDFAFLPPFEMKTERIYLIADGCQSSFTDSYVLHRYTFFDLPAQLAFLSQSPFHGHFPFCCQYSII